MGPMRAHARRVRQRDATLPESTVVCLVLALCLVARPMLTGAGAADAAARAAPAEYSVTCASAREGCEVVHGIADDALAWGAYSGDGAVNTTGWATLSVRTANATYRRRDWLVPDVADAQAFAAGFLEGALTHRLIAAFHGNFMTATFNNATTAGRLVKETGAFLLANREWVMQQAAMPANQGDTYWAQIRWNYAQVDGLLAGYTSAAATAATEVPQLELVDMLFLNAQGDIGDLVAKLDPTLRPDFRTISSASEGRELARRQSHCSCIVKYTPDMQELYMAHNMWWQWYSMMRVLKTYEFPAVTPRAGKNLSTSILLSSYPAVLSSTDDFYIVSGGLVVMETTNNVWNASLYDKVTTNGTVMSWVRVNAASRLAVNGSDWTSVFRQHNSGTYNNMWMVVDVGLFEPGKPLPPGVLTIIEQLPGFTQAGDVTEVLGFGLWPSYNRAYFPATRELSGQNAMVQKFGNFFSYHGNPRATIYRRDAGNVATIADLQRFMRYNKWQTDPLSLGDPGNAIAARFDLRPNASAAHADGAADAKVTSASMALAMQAMVVQGPTHDDQPVFSWDEKKFNMPHAGQASSFPFEWMQVSSDTM